MGSACSVPRRTFEPVWLSSVKSAAYFRLISESMMAGPSICSGDEMVSARSWPYVAGSLETAISAIRFLRSSFSEKGTNGRTRENCGRLLPGHVEHGVVRVEAGRAGAGGGDAVGRAGRRHLGRTRVDGLGRLLGDAPDLVPLEELVRVVDVVLPVHVRLHPEQVLGVAEVSSDLGGDLLTRVEQVRERLGPGVDHRVGGVDDVEGDRALVGVDGGLHRVADVVVGVAQAAVGRQLVVLRVLGVRVAGARRVAVQHPHQLPVRDDRIGIGVEVQEGRQHLHPLSDVADVEDAAVLVDQPRAEQVVLAEP